MKIEKIAVLNFVNGEVLISSLSEREDIESFFQRKGLRSEDVQWMRGDLKIIIENEN